MPKLRWTPYGVDRRLVGLGPETVAANAENFLFENGRIFQRPGMFASTLTNLAANHSVIYAESVMKDFAPELYLLTDNGAGTQKVYYDPGTGVLAEVTPSAGAWSTTTRFLGFLGEIFLTSTNGGIYHFSGGGGGAAAQIIPDPYQYITSLLSRVVVANPSTRTIAWSVPGDGTDWSSAGSGTNTLADVEDRIEGIFNSRNRLVIMRTMGITMGYPTGSSEPAFRFENFADELDPVLCGMCHHSDKVYWVGNSNIYSFDGTQIERFGDPVIGEITQYARVRGTKWIGFIAEGGGESSATPLSKTTRLRYHLVPQSDYTAQATFGPVHYVYDFEEKVWSRHSYGSTADFGAAANRRNLSTFGYTSTPNLYSFSSPNRTTRYQWAEQTLPDQPAFVESAIIVTGEEEKDYIVDRIMLMYRDVGAANLTFELRTMLNTTQNTLSVTFPVGSVGATTNMIRKWIDGRLPGNGFKLKVTCPASARCDLTFASAMYDEAGDYRGQ